VHGHEMTVLDPTVTFET